MIESKSARVFITTREKILLYLCSKLLPPNGWARKRSNIPLNYCIVSLSCKGDQLAGILTPDHADRVTYLKCGLEHEIWHKPVNSFERSERFWSIVGGHKLLKRRRCEPTWLLLDITHAKSIASLRNSCPFSDSLIVGWKVSNIRCHFNDSKYVRQPI